MDFQNSVSVAKNVAKDAFASAVCGTMLLASGAAFSAEFTDRVTSAKAIDSATLRSNSKSGIDNYGAIIMGAVILVGFVFMVWGIIWIMSAGRSEGRKNAGPGWIMAIGGGALGAGMSVYLLFVQFFSGIAS